MKKSDKEYYRRDWPEHYYEIEDINERESVLKEVLNEDPSSKEDQRRLEILHQRYGKVPLHQRPDHFMHALLMIRQMQDARLNALNSRKKYEEFIQYMDELCLSDEPDDLLYEEYRDLLQNYIRATYKSFSRPAFLGMGKRTDHKVWDTVEEDIRIIFAEIPHKFHCDEEFKQLYAIAKDELKRMQEEN